MGSTTDKIAGIANVAIGNVKQGVGKAVGSERLQAGGLAQDVKGEAQKAAGNAKAAVKDGADTVANTIIKAFRPLRRPANSGCRRSSRPRRCRSGIHHCRGRQLQLKVV